MRKPIMNKLYTVSLTIAKPPTGIIKYKSVNVKVLMGATNSKVALMKAQEYALKELQTNEKLADCFVKNVSIKEVQFDMFFDVSKGLFQPEKKQQPMINNIQVLSNSQVQICYDLINEMVMIFSASQLKYPQRTYAGFDGLKEKFDELAQCFNEETDVQFSINYFKQNFIQTIIQK